jgi:KDO2-lipid IV(A) lauroyltransferase
MKTSEKFLGQGSSAVKLTNDSISLRLQRALLSGLVQTLAALPITWRSYLGRSLGTFFALLPTNERKIALLQLRYYLGPEHATQSTVNRIFANLGESVLESLDLMPYLNNSERTFFMNNFEEFQKVSTSGKPFLILTAHTGNWDLLAAYACKIGLPLLTVGRKANNVLIQELLASIRKKYGIETIWRTSTFSSRKLIEGIASGRALAGLIDQDTKVDGTPVPFFGELATCPSALISLAKRRNIPIITAFNFRVGSGRFQLFWKRLDTDLPVEQIILEYNQFLESLLKRFPDQWVWFHKRWRTRPDGYRLSGAEYLRKLEQQLQTNA